MSGDLAGAGSGLGAGSGETFRAEEGSLGELGMAVGEALVRRGWTLAVAESCTGGWIAKVITDVPGASRYLVGGAVVYADGAKERMLDISPALLEAHGAVSEEIVRAMADGVKRSLGADVGLAVTGVAGPEGRRPGKPVGTVWFGLALPSGAHARTALFPGDREAVRRGATAHALAWLVERVASGGRRPSDVNRRLPNG